MKINDKNFPLVTILVVFFILYIFLGFRLLEKKIQFVPQWTIDVSNAEPSDFADGQDRLIPFKLGNNWGYYTPEGSVRVLKKTNAKPIISEAFWAEFTADDETAFFTPEGRQSGLLSEVGIPFFGKKDIFVFHPGGSSFSAHNIDGTKKWFYEDYAPITAFSSSVAGCALGFADGKLLCFDTSGTKTQEFYPGGSEYEVIFGAALSESGTYSACLAGIHKQRLIVTHISGGQSKIVFHQYLDDALFEQSLVQFSTDERYVFFNTSSGLSAVDIAKKAVFTIPFEGKILRITESEKKDIFFLLSKKQNQFTLRVFSDSIKTVGSFSFAGDSAFLYSEGRDLYVGCDTRISKMTVKRD